MLYGENKRRTMLRSILPSTARKGARYDKRYAHKVERARTRDALDHIWDFESAVDCNHDVLYDCDVEIHSIKWDRRGADKINHFVRWATKVTEHIEEPVERKDHMRSLVPDNLIGRHALTHLPFDWDRDAYRYTYRNRHRNAADEARLRRDNYIALWTALYETCTKAGMQKRFNDILKSNFLPGHKDWKETISYCPNCSVGPRVLRGIGDISAWIEDWHANDLWTRWELTWYYRGFSSMQRARRVWAPRHHGEVWSRALRFLVDQNFLDLDSATSLGLSTPRMLRLPLDMRA